MVARHSSSDTSSIQLKYAFAALLYRTSILPKVLTARSTTAWHCSGSVRSQGCNDTILPPAASTSFRAARPLVSLMSQPTTIAPWRVKSRAAARPILPPVPVMTHTLPSSRPLIVSLRSEYVRSLGPDPILGDGDMLIVIRSGHLLTHVVAHAFLQRIASPLEETG